MSQMCCVFRREDEMNEFMNMPFWGKVIMAVLFGASWAVGSAIVKALLT